MKNVSKLILALGLLMLIFAYGGTFAQAATAPTVGDVKFEANDDAEGGKPWKPGEETDEKPIEEIQPDGGSSNGALRIEHVPSISFGVQKISSATEWYKAKWGQGKVDGKEYKIPAFAQITDERGIDQGFSLTVSQSSLFTNEADPTNVLNNARIQLHNKQIYNSLSQTPADLLEGLTALDTPTTKSVDIPYGASQSLMVLQTKANKTTDGSRSSIVFADAASYDPTTFFTASGQPTNETQSGVQLRVPGNDKKENNATYKATLTWTLNNTL